jgi:hypothetical protein
MSKLDAYTLRANLTARDIGILEDLKRFRLLSTRQIQRLHFPHPGAHSTVVGATRATHRVLQRLQTHLLLAQLERRVGGPERGSATALWQLAEQGTNVLHLGVEEAKRSRYREPTTSLFVRHTIAIADVAVAITEHARATGLELLALQTEPDAWRSFLGENGQPESLRPDLFAAVANADFEQHSFVEIDMATEHQPQILRKCQLYARYAANGAAEQQTGVVPRVVWVAPTLKRRDALGRMITGDSRLPTAMFTVVATENAASEITTGLVEEPE